MELNVQINPEDINRTLVEAIAKSAIGIELEKIIKQQVQKMSSSYDNPITPVVQEHIFASIRNVIRENYSDQIKTWVTEKVTEQFTQDLFDKMWNKFTGSY